MLESGCLLNLFLAQEKTTSFEMVFLVKYHMLYQNNFARIVLNKCLNVILRGLFHSAKLLFASGGASDVNTNLPFSTVYHESFDNQYDRVLLLVINIRLLYVVKHIFCEVIINPTIISFLKGFQEFLFCYSLMILHLPFHFFFMIQGDAFSMLEFSASFVVSIHCIYHIRFIGNLVH